MGREPRNSRHAAAQIRHRRYTGPRKLGSRVIRIREALDRSRRNREGLTSGVVRFCLTVMAGTAIGFVGSLVHVRLSQLFGQYSKLSLPRQSLSQAIAFFASLVLIALLKRLPQKVWRSMRLGLVPISSWVWVLSVAVFWIEYDDLRPIAWASIGFGVLVTVTSQLIKIRSTPNADTEASRFVEPDLPVQEDGEDLLGRQDSVEALVSTILLDSPAIIAVTGGYGEGKTSFLNLAIGELKKAQEISVPMIVRFSPWLPADPNALVLSLLNSVVSEIKRTLVVPGLRGDAARYARILMSVVPWTERLKNLIAEPSQEARIDALVSRIAKMGRRVLVVLDDLDRNGGGRIGDGPQVAEGIRQALECHILMRVRKV